MSAGESGDTGSDFDSPVAVPLRAALSAFSVRGAGTTGTALDTVTSNSKIVVRPPSQNACGFARQHGSFVDSYHPHVDRTWRATNPCVRLLGSARGIIPVVVKGDAAPLHARKNPLANFRSMLADTAPEYNNVCLLYTSDAADEQ